MKVPAYGYGIYDEWEGTGVHRLYDRPWTVRTKDGWESTTVQAFRTAREAYEFIRLNQKRYTPLWVENWNRIPITTV